MMQICTHGIEAPNAKCRMVRIYFCGVETPVQNAELCEFTLTGLKHLVQNADVDVPDLQKCTNGVDLHESNFQRILKRDKFDYGAQAVERG